MKLQIRFKELPHKIFQEWNANKIFLRQHKHEVILSASIITLVLSLWWYIAERNIAIEDIENGGISMPLSSEDGQPKADVNNKEVMFSVLGNFWMEIQKGDLHIKAPVVEGVTDEKLAQGLGHHKTTAFPNNQTGNVVISGHRWKYGSNPAFKVFEHLDELGIGDLVALHYNGVQYDYEITKQEVVDGSDMQILDQTEAPTLTLYTCTPIYTSFRRLVYVAKLIDLDK
jgi:LPXTG-site transpeptidase (sortase) family protein